MTLFKNLHREETEMICYKPVRENIKGREVLRKSCNELLEQLDILDSIPVGQLSQAAYHEKPICNAITQIVRVAERY